MSLLVTETRLRPRGYRETAITIRPERTSDVAPREQLLDDAFGLGRFAKTSERLREGRMPAEGLAFIASDGGRVVGTVRLWPIAAGSDRPCLLLGPLAVAPDARNRGIGGALMRRAMREAKKRGHRAVLLVGDPGYYGRFGFSAENTSELWMPGPFERERLLACELAPEALKGVHGMIAPYRLPRRDDHRTWPAAHRQIEWLGGLAKRLFCGNYGGWPGCGAVR